MVPYLLHLEEDLENTAFQLERRKDLKDWYDLLFCLIFIFYLGSGKVGQKVLNLSRNIKS